MLTAALGTASYNGYTWNATARSRVDGVPVFDRANRTVTHTNYTLTITWLMYAGDGGSIGTQMETARRQLEAEGKALVYKDNGFGNFELNNGDANKVDILWGPKPSRIIAEPIGRDKVWACTWICQFSIKECNSLTLGNNSIMAFNFGVSYVIDERGLTTRTYSGYLQIPVYRRANGSWTTADDLRELIRVNPLPGFRRRPREFKLSEDRSTLEFTIVDEQVARESLPWGCIKADGAFTVSNDGPNVATRWSARLQATYQVSPEVNRNVAAEAFWNLARDRMQHVANQAGRDFRPLLLGMSTTEGLYESNLTVSFALAWTFFSSLEHVLRNAGMWRPVPNTDHAQYVTSVGNILGNRGNGGLRFDPGEDAIINLCEARSPGFRGNPVLRYGGDGAPRLSNVTSAGYLDFQNEIQLSQDNGYVEHRLLAPGQERFAASLSTGGSAINSPPSATLPPYQPPQATPAQTRSIQARLAPSHYVRMRGYSLCAGEAGPAPSLSQFAGMVCVPDNPQFVRQRRVGEVVGTPLYLTQWYLCYMLAEPPGGVRNTKIPKSFTPKEKPSAAFGGGFGPVILFPWLNMGH